MGDKLDLENKYRVVLLELKDIVQMVFAPVLSKNNCLLGIQNEATASLSRLSHTVASPQTCQLMSEDIKCSHQ